MSDSNSNRKHMKVNVNHPSFVSFLENISDNILSTIKIDEYFKLTPTQKLKTSYTVLNLIKNSAKVKSNLSDEELKSFIAVLCKKNEDVENYEFASVLNDIVKNYEKVNRVPPKKNSPPKKNQPKKKTPKPKPPE